MRLCSNGWMLSRASRMRNRLPDIGGTCQLIPGAGRGGRLFVVALVLQEDDLLAQWCRVQPAFRRNTGLIC